MELPRPLIHALGDPWEHWGGDYGHSLIAPRRDGPAVEGAILAGPAGFCVVGVAQRLWGGHRCRAPLQPLLRGFLLFAGAAAGQVTAALLDPQADGVGSHDHCQECNSLWAKANEKATRRSLAVPHTIQAPPPTSCSSLRPEAWKPGSLAFLHTQYHLYSFLSQPFLCQTSGPLTWYMPDTAHQSQVLPCLTGLLREADWSSWGVLVLFSANLFCLFKFISTIF